MKPIEFAEQNKIYTAPESMPECLPLPVFQNETQIISCWQMTPEEKLKAVFFGKVWLSMFCPAQVPVWLAVDQTVFEGQETLSPDIFIEQFKARKIEQFLAIKQNEAGEFLSDGYLEASKIVLMEFLNFLFEDKADDLS